MEINITLFIQMVHFYIAYVILDCLILRPAVSTIQEEQHQYNTLITTLNNQLQLLKEKELNRFNQWQQFRNELKGRIPHLPQEGRPELTVHIKEILSFNQEQKQQYKEELITSLTRRLNHVS